MNEHERQSDELVKLLHVDSEFEAHAKAAVLHEQGIDAQVIRDGASWAGMIRLSATEDGAGVWIRRQDLEAARGALEQNVADSVDLDWDEVDVGSPEEEGAFESRNGMPIPAQFAFYVTLMMLLLCMILAIAVIFG